MALRNLCTCIDSFGLFVLASLHDDGISADPGHPLHESGTGMAFTLYEFFADQVEDKAIGGLPLAVLSTCTCLPSSNEHYICLILRLPTY